jgi:hypothetical protein
MVAKNNGSSLFFIFLLKRDPSRAVMSGAATLHPKEYQ